VANTNTSKLAGAVAWDDGATFDGYVKMDIVFPTDESATAWTNLYKKPDSDLVAVELPIWSVIPIKGGEFNQATGLIFNADMVPHNTSYTATYYDQTLKLIAGPTDSFLVTAAETTPPIPTLPAPNAV